MDEKDERLTAYLLRHWREHLAGGDAVEEAIRLLEKHRIMDAAWNPQGLTTTEKEPNSQGGWILPMGFVPVFENPKAINPACPACGQAADHVENGIHCRKP